MLTHSFDVGGEHVMGGDTCILYTHYCSKEFKDLMHIILLSPRKNDNL